MSIYYETAAYRELVTAVRSMDMEASARIIQRQVDATTGPEQAFWLLMQFGRRMNQSVTPREYGSMWPQLQQILAIAPNDAYTVSSVANMAILIYAYSEFPEVLVRLRPWFRAYRHDLLKDSSIRANLAIILAKKRRWYSAYRNQTLDEILFEQMPESQRQGREGYKHFTYAGRAVSAVALGWYDQAEIDVAKARAIMEERPPGYFTPDFMALADAALHHARGRYQEARVVLQIATTHPNRRYRRRPGVEVDFLLMAARIARSERNLRGFTHFCRQARVLCAENDLPLSAAAVEAVANGAEY